MKAILSVLLLLTLAGVSKADTYDINQIFGSAGSTVGTITTDGNLGVLTPIDITSWNLTLTDGSSSTILTPLNSTVGSGVGNVGGLNNVDLTATSSSLLFDFSGGDAGSWGFSGGTGQFCLTTYSNCFGPAPALGTYGVGGNSWNFSVISGQQVIASAVPEPSSLSMCGAVLVAFGGMRRMRLFKRS